MKKQPFLKMIKSVPNIASTTIIDAKNFNVWFHEHHVLNDVSVGFQENQINCIVGPSGSGKSTLIRSINRLNDTAEGVFFKGAIEFNGKNIYHKSVDETSLRKEIGMVFQKPCIFPKSISQNVLFGIQHLRKLSKLEKMQIVEETLTAVSLWKEVSHRLNEKADTLSIGQQQRLCIARTLAVNPEVIVLDEPTSSLDPVSTRAIEDLMLTLKEEYTLVFVTHDILQAKRISDHLIFMCNGQVIEQGSKEQLFNSPKEEQTRSYLIDEYCEC
jgi:phosphate transport system ATP-binding protein